MGLHHNASLHLYDFDGTICFPNSTLDFLKFYVKRKNKKFKTLTFYSYWIIAKILKDIKIINSSTYTRLRLQILRGETRNKFMSYANDYCELLTINNRVNDTLISEIQLKNEAQSEIAVLSFGLVDIIRPFLNYHNLDAKVFSSKLEYDKSNKLTGKYAFNLEPFGKLDFLLTMYNENVVRDAYYVSDDPEADGEIVTFVKYFRKV